MRKKIASKKTLSKCGKTLGRKGGYVSGKRKKLKRGKR